MPADFDFSRWSNLAFILQQMVAAKVKRVEPLGKMVKPGKQVGVPVAPRVQLRDIVSARKHEVLIICEVWGASIDWGAIGSKVCSTWGIWSDDVSLSLVGMPTNRALYYISK